jgi:hypothetical protein
MWVVDHCVMYLEASTWERKVHPMYMHPYTQLLPQQPTYKSTNLFFKEFCLKKWNSSYRMVLEWREREHEEVGAVVERDPGAQLTLKRCKIYNFWALKRMRAQVRLLQIPVKFWNSDTEAFNLDGKLLRIEVEDIYFLT